MKLKVQEFLPKGLGYWVQLSVALKVGSGMVQSSKVGIIIEKFERIATNSCPRLRQAG